MTERLQIAAPAKAVVLASGSGTLLQAVLDAAARADYPLSVAAVGSDRDGVEALRRAERAGVPHFTVRMADQPGRVEWNEALADAVAVYEPDLVVSAGFMKIVGDGFLRRFRCRVLNSHPALLPAFPGMTAVDDALRAGVKITGCTLHLVDSGVDTGPIVAQQAVEIQPDDDESSLHDRIKAAERRQLVDVLARIARQGCTVDGRKVSIP